MTNLNNNNDFVGTLERKIKSVQQNNLEPSEDLKTVLRTSERLRSSKSSDITFSPPVLLQNGNGVLWPRTINLIQGQTGVHKSRLAEVIGSATIKKDTCNNSLLQYELNSHYPSYALVYVDTERNLTEQLPFALQSIQVNGGYSKSDHPNNFYYISLLQIERKGRFPVLKEYISHIRATTNSPLLIVLDVSTDCIDDFNKVDKSMELIDLMNMTINEMDVIFLCIIHENPRSEKARGHIGSELLNKSSTVMQVGFEKDANQNDTEIIRVKYLKCRSTSRHTPFHIKYSSEAKGLVLADPIEVSKILHSRKTKANNEAVIESLEVHLGDGCKMARTELIENLVKDLNVSQRTVEARLSEIVSNSEEIFNKTGTLCHLTKEMENKITFYKLVTNE